MKGYLLRFLVSIFLVIFIASGLYYFIEQGLKNYSSSNYIKFNEMFNDSTFYDVLLIGSSRTHRNIDNNILDSILNIKVYNGGISGAGGFEMVTAFKGYLYKHRPPKVVILNVDPGIMNIDRTFFNTSFYFDSFKNPSIYESFKEKGFPVWLYKSLPFTKIFEYNDDLRNSSIQGLLGKKDMYSNGYNGYLPMKEDIGKFDTIYTHKLKMNYTNNNLQYVDSILEISQRYKIFPVFIVAPVYNNHYAKKYDDYERFIKLINDRLSCYTPDEMIFFDKLPLNYSNKYFDDNIHLNSTGVMFFSKILAKRILEFDILKKTNLNVIRNENPKTFPLINIGTDSNLFSLIH